MEARCRIAIRARNIGYAKHDLGRIRRARGFFQE